MVKNVKGGKGAKKQKNSKNKEDPKDKIRPLELKEGPYEAYGVVIKKFGGPRLSVRYYNEKNKCLENIYSIVCGRIRKVRFFVGDVVLLSFREYQDGKADIVYRYDNDQIYKLKKKGELLQSLQDCIVSEEDKEERDKNIDFGEEEEEDDEEFKEMERKRKEFNFEDMYADMDRRMEDDEDD